MIRTHLRQHPGRRAGQRISGWLGFGSNAGQPGVTRWVSGEHGGLPGALWYSAWLEATGPKTCIGDKVMTYDSASTAEMTLVCPVNVPQPRLGGRPVCTSQGGPPRSGA